MTVDEEAAESGGRPGDESAPAGGPPATEPAAEPPGAGPGSAAGLETRVRDIGLRLFAAMTQERPLRSASSFISGRAMQRRILAQAMADPHFKTQLFRFVDVYPSIRDSGDLVRHLRAYLDDGGTLPRPLDRLVASGDRRLPTWAVARLTEKGMQRMARSLIAGRDATDALPALKRLRRRRTGFTLDILGEACLSDAEAEDYVRRYHDLLDTLPPKAARWSSEPAVDQAPWGPEPRVNLSLKVTSLYSQIDPLDFEGSRRAVFAALKPLFLKARDSGSFLNLDLERFVHRDLTYAVFADLCLDPDLRDYPHLGIVVQSYLRDSADTVKELIRLAQERGTPITVRLVKGAYWDYETILAAQEHWPCPVFLSKGQTDAQFERLAAALIEEWQWTRPALGTHNIRSIAAAMAAAEAAGLPAGAVEIQVLHGMADAVRRAAVAQGYRVREYVPVGELIPGMAYLVRRLLENTANESFLRLTFAQGQDPETLLAPPVETPDAEMAAESPPPGPAPAGSPAVFQNEPHADFSRPEARAAMQRALATIGASLGRDYSLIIGGEAIMTADTAVSVNPARPAEVVGRVAVAGRTEADRALDAAVAAFPGWRDTPAAERAAALMGAAALMRERRFELAALEVVEAGKPWREADADVTEAIDFLEYYSREVLRLATVRDLSDVPGEEDSYFYEPRGVAAVIAPWNFPLAIPTGMLSAALAAGNTVVFKPAGPTPVLGYALVRMLHEAGVPGGAVNFVPGPGGDVGDYLVSDPRVDLIAFTGSLEAGLSIMAKAATVSPGQRSLKKVVAELGGKNAIIVDTDADLDAAVEGVVISAFHYAGQKCSACSRVIVLEQVYEQFLKRLVAAAASLRVGDPVHPGTRVGPVISAEAQGRILGYIATGKEEAALVLPPPAGPERARALAAAAAEPWAAEPEAGRWVDGEWVPAQTDTAPGEEATAEAAETGTEESRQAAARAEQTSARIADGDPGPPAGAAGAAGVDDRTGGYFVPPHIFVDVPPEAVIAQEEIFGPVLAVMKARDFDEALRLALGVRYALTGGLYSRSPVNIRRAYRDFRVGNFYINRPITGAMVGRQPFGGSRMSGVGSKAGGPDYLLQFLEPRTVTENTVRRGFAPAEEAS